MDSGHLMQLLAARHTEDVFVPECKDGPSMGETHVRLDGWAMTRSWSHFTTYGYEVKVSRSDFQRDTKWQSYLKYCHEFYWVCPANLISVNEVADVAGLLWTTKSGNRLIMKKRAPRRDIQIPWTLWAYIVMCRTKITSDTQDRRAYYQSVVEARNDDARLGQLVSRILARKYRRDVDSVRHENDRLQARQHYVEEMERTFVGLGIDVMALYSEHSRKRAAQAAVIGLTTQEIEAIRSAHEGLTRLLKTTGQG